MDYNKIEGVNTSLDAGSIKYSAKAFYMKDINGDSIFENKLQCLSMLYALLDKFGDENIKK